MYSDIRVALGYYRQQLINYRLLLGPITRKMGELFANGDWDISDLDNTDLSAVMEWETKLRYMAEALGLTPDEVEWDNDAQLKRPRPRKVPVVASQGR